MGYLVIVGFFPFSAENEFSFLFYFLFINFFLLPIKLLPLLNLSLQPDLCSALPHATRSSSVVILSRPPTSSSLRITNRAFRYASPHLWNQLPVSFRQPCIKHRADDVTLSNSPPTCSPLSHSTTYSLFHSRLKTELFHRSFPPESTSTHIDCLLGLHWTGLTLLKGFLFSVIFLFFFYFGSCGRLSWLNCQVSSAR